MSTGHRQKPRFKVGEYVSFLLGRRPVWVQVIEDRGRLGVKGRRLYRVRIVEESGESATFEASEDDLTRAQPDRPSIIDYLKQGGLLAILRSNLAGGRHQPKVWLALDSHGRLIHTFSAEHGLIGGATVPFLALYEDKVFTPKANEVIEFLSSFGLNRDDAEDVLASVGRAP